VSAGKSRVRSERGAEAVDEGEPARIAGSLDARPSPSTFTPASVPLQDEGADLQPASAGAAPTNLFALLAAAWLAGAVLSLLRALWFERAFRHRLAQEPPVDESALLALIEEARQCIGLKRPVAVVRTALVSTPAVTGVRRPRLLLPQHAVDGLERDALLGVVLHELAHLRRGDVLKNAGLTLVGALYWFHPLVRLAVRRLRTEIEALRDRDALDAHPDPDPVGYARTLIELLEAPRGAQVRGPAPAPALGILSSGADIRRRILMITSNESTSRRPWIVGAGLCLALGWAAFTSAANPTATPPPQDGGPDERLSDGLRRVRVERHLPREAWREAAEAELDKAISVEFQGVNVEGALAFLRQVTELDVVLDRDVYADDFELDVALPERSVAQVLDLVCELTGRELDWGLVRGAVYVGFRGELPEEKDLRFYKVEDLVGADQDGPDRLVDLVQELSTGDWSSWEVEGTSIDYWNGLLVVRQTDRVHADVEAFLSRLLNRGASPGGPSLQWTEDLARAMASRVPVSMHSVTLGEAADQLSALTGVPIVVDADWSEEEVDLELQRSTLESVLGFLADQHGLNVVVEEGVVYVTQRLQVSLEFYDVGELWRLAEHPDELRDQIEWLIRDTIDPESWDTYPECGIYYWRDQMLVVQSPAAQARVDALLDALRRALR
jgi:beta-lactamase regulating signal transducer with metallopeptidase domain